MYSTQQCPPQSSLRNPISLFFIIMLILYLYSSRIILHNHHSECSDTILTKKTLKTQDSSSFSSSSNSSLIFPTNETNQETTPIRSNHLMLPQTAPERFDTELKHIAFGIAASSNFWDNRKEYIKQWWRPGETRGVVWLDKKVTTRRSEGLPEIRVPGDTTKFKYTNRQGSRSALRISRVVSETLRLGLKDIRWFVMGDDDTVFVVENVVRVVSKYDHNQFYYVGSSSESHVQNIYFFVCNGIWWRRIRHKYVGSGVGKDAGSMHSTISGVVWK